MRLQKKVIFLDKNVEKCHKSVSNIGYKKVLASYDSWLTKMIGEP